MSNSKTWQIRKKELAQKEKLLLKDIHHSRAKKIVLWSVGAGVLALVGYGIYMTVSTAGLKQIKTRVKKKWMLKNFFMIDSAIKKLIYTFGKWLLKQLKD